MNFQKLVKYNKLKKNVIRNVLVASLEYMYIEYIISNIDNFDNDNNGCDYNKIFNRILL